MKGTMSSIAAILCRSAPPDPALVRRMLAAAPHYGNNHTIKVQGSCVVGVCGESDGIGSAISVEGDWIAGFAGRLDNAAEISALVTNLGFRPTSPAPADLLRSAFQAYGSEAPNRLRGVFAAVVTNGHDLWCFRDHLGWRSLFYRDDPAGFFVASEAKQIIAGTGILKEPNLEVLELLFYGRLTKETPSALKGIKRLPQATVMVVNSSGTAKAQPYWRPAEILETSRLSADELGDGFSEVFGKTIRRSLTGQDVISLSGGIDSPAVAGFAAPLHRELTGRPISALSTVYPNHPKVDERVYIELIAKYLEIDLHTFTPQAGPWDDVARWCRLFDGPIPTLSLDEVTEYYKQAYQLGFRNVLSGDIAEAVFNLNRHVVGHLVTHARWRPLLNMVRTLRQQGTSWKQLGHLMLTPFIPGWLANRYLHFRGLDYPFKIPNWLDARKINEVPFRRDLLPPGRDRWAMVQLRPFSGDSLTLEAGEVCAMLCGVTARCPFSDIDVIEFFLSLPAELKFPDLRSKTLMRRLIRGHVPDEILDRRTKTFFTDYIMSHINYAPLRQFLVNPASRIHGVKYEILADRIERQDFKLIDYAWANDLVRIHAFLSLW
jgi:asparagine synthase (glutamine-hydrolysing)